MINEEDLNKCIENLARLSTTSTRSDRQLLLEIGYILKQELDNVKAWNSSHKNGQRRNEQIDVKKLLEDNTQLFKENQTLLSAVANMKDVIEHQLPNINEELVEIDSKFDLLNKQLENF